jgi:hypothetical protein
MLPPTYIPFYNLPTYLQQFVFVDTGRNLTCQNDQSNGPYFASQKNHPTHNGHVEINLSKMTSGLFVCPFKLGIYL